MPTRQEIDQLNTAGRHYRGGDLDAAEQICRRLLRKNGKLADAHQLLGLIAVKHKRFEEAILAYERCLKLQPHNPRYAYLMGKAHVSLGRSADALEWFDRSLEHDPGNVETIGWKAWALERAGRAEEALALIEPLMQAERPDLTVVEAYVRARQRTGEHEEAVRAAQRCVQDPATSPLVRFVLFFLSAKSLEKLGRYDDAFAAYTEGNRVLAQPFRRADFATAIDAQIETFAAEALPALPRSTCRSGRPVFIAGMPRSGTTLIEQIIDAHPGASGVGEITDIEAIVTSLPKRCRSKLPYPACLRDATPRLLTDVANEYLRRLDRLGTGTRIVNKNLFNWQHLGLISLLFPGAYIIDCRRDPVDTCTSCFMSELMPAKMPYTTNLTSLGFAYRQYERLMAHWARVLDARLLRVEYEEVVADLPTQARRIIDFLDLDWDDRCERFHESGRTAQTLSYDQVQQPIYKSSVGRAERFGAHLDPLRQALAQAPTPTPTDE